MVGWSVGQREGLLGYEEVAVDVFLMREIIANHYRSHSFSCLECLCSVGEGMEKGEKEYELHLAQLSKSSRESPQSPKEESALTVVRQTPHLLQKSTSLPHHSPLLLRWQNHNKVRKLSRADRLYSAMDCHDDGVENLEEL